MHSSSEVHTLQASWESHRQVETFQFVPQVAVTFSLVSKLYKVVYALYQKSHIEMDFIHTDLELREYFKYMSISIRAWTLLWQMKKSGLAYD